MSDTMTKPPMPNTRHPSLPDLDVDAMMERRSRGPIVYMTSEPRPAWDPAVFYTDPPRSLLEWRRCGGPAPYVGRAFVYIWDCLVETDGTNRAIAGSARIEYLPFDPGNPATWSTAWSTAPSPATPDQGERHERTS